MTRRMRIVGCCILVESVLVGSVAMHAAESSVANGHGVLDRQTREALEFGIQGQTRKRSAALHEALKADPENQLARWSLGQVRIGDQWLGVSEAEVVMAQDERLQSYLKRFAARNGNPAIDLHLAKWCHAQGMHEAAEFHYAQVLHNSASSDRLRSEASRGLKLQNYQGQWLTADQVASARERDAARAKAFERWTPRVQRWGKALSRGNQKQRTYARKQLDEVDDLEIIPVLDEHLSPLGEQPASVVVHWLSGRPEVESTESLVRHALDAPWPSVRHASIQELADRPIHDYVPELLGQLMTPVESTFRLQYLPSGGVSYEQSFRRAGLSENVEVREQFVDAPQVRYAGGAPSRTGRYRTVVGLAYGNNSSALDRAEAIAEARQRAQWFALMANVKARKVQQDVDKVNRVVSQNNDRIYPVLQATTGAEPMNHPESWWGWWDQYNELYSPPKNTRFWYGGHRTYDYPFATYVTPLSCFAAGTLVRTDMGLKKIETIAPGNRVLAQDVDSGELAYKVVKLTTQRPPSAFIRVSFDDSSVVTTKGHLFWVNGKGWRMAKRLAVDDVLHGAAEPRVVTSIEAANTDVAFNLVVDDFGTYFVGEAGLLVHDNNPRQPTLSVTPGLAMN